jgi:hypothetical protein
MSLNHVTSYSTLQSSEWSALAFEHQNLMIELLYPKLDESKINFGKDFTNDLKPRQHLVHEHPVYNFLHRYYRYSTSDLLKYSPGIRVNLKISKEKNIHRYLNSKYIFYDSNDETYRYDPGSLFNEENHFKKICLLQENFNILSATCKRLPHFTCYGLHEWAMLFSNKSTNVTMDRHQNLKLRVSQDVIDELVTNFPIRCTHFDAFRFFHPDAQPLNFIDPLTKQNRIEYEQPGCIHANMDLFKYAFQLYPFLPSALLRASLEIAIKARKIDMRASPYDVSHVRGCESPLCVETVQGRQQYVIEQKNLFKDALSLRKALLKEYEMVLNDEIIMNKLTETEKNNDHSVSTLS